MRLMVVASVLLVLSTGIAGAVALPEGFLDPSNATLKTGKLQIDGRDEATVNFSVTNHASQPVAIIAVDCTALVEDEPIETNSHPVQNVGSGETAYGAVDFFKLRGNAGATVRCRIEYIRIGF
ncbi:hypothetical protein [Lichenifustis flavocetrariae]|uniref:DUF1573 domain-containing protein n=1 Tax=Lichenifustis flavocetrariae TaxID=2949735 RepID=A0AA42CNS8_9HYPH|nr:hypothetical protein [Lichenifustis flavocetrariae]MCW6509707.1 hypothetical protein [Lichenifustis flavocetrariae]